MKSSTLTLCQAVARHFDVTVDDILSRDRSKAVAEARAVSMWLARSKLGMSYPELGREFVRDHSTCMSSVRKIENATGMLLASARILSLQVVSPRIPLELVAVGAE